MKQKHGRRLQEPHLISMIWRDSEVLIVMNGNKDIKRFCNGSVQKK